MRWTVAALSGVVAWLWLRTVAHRRRLERLEMLTGAWRVAGSWPAPTGKSLAETDPWVDEMLKRFAS